jgi:predicted flavoprotein YhiN
VVIVGAGPAGIMAAISSARHGERVLILDQLDRPGLKLLATGGGRCNITNTLDSNSLMECFGKSGRFMQPALSAMNGHRLRGFLAELGVPTVIPDGFHVFPASNRSETVLHALWKACADMNVKRMCGTEATELIVQQHAVAGLRTSSGPREPSCSRPGEKVIRILARRGRVMGLLPAPATPSSIPCPSLSR